MTTDLQANIDSLDANNADFSDPNLYANLLGYNVEAPEVQDTPSEEEGDTEQDDEGTDDEGGNADDTGAAADSQKSSEAPAAADAKPKDEPPPEGIATKDGKRVIPYAVLEGTRAEANALKAKNAELATKLEELQRQAEAAKTGKAGGKDATEEVDFSPEELDELAADFPQMAKLAKGYAALKEQVTAKASEPASSAPQANATANAVQEAIDNQPLLARWQSKGGAAWAEAVNLDAQLKDDPEWANKPLAERFAEVERRVADDLGIPLQATKPATPKPQAGQPAAARTPVKPETVTPTLTDLSGSPTFTSGDPLAGMTKGQMVDKAMTMDVEALMRMVGVNP